MGCRLWRHTELDTTEVTSQQQQYVFIRVEPFGRKRVTRKRLVSQALSLTAVSLL